ncbi:hypothetical protein CAPTEDRAFT_127156 [Capitella teleta]|uniref:Syntaxin-18 n=1 Tax=Capitella teleta TaxID=283909 RepID=R7V229_CAPTE|nr:hypothetical protein CAPTEDRAFT_127156 [Capitella teleta]|eukprot:ELU09741.1 hypothetical protein CAPTEDRAFT_127156 [Capitella teleta]
MTDITNLFRATVKTVRTRQKKDKPIVDQSIIGSSKKRGEFAVKSRNVVVGITKLRDFLLEHQKEYLSGSNALGWERSTLTDADRDQIDNNAQVIIRTCSEAIKILRNEAFMNKLQPQVEEHRKSALALIDGYLKAVCKVYSEQKAIRVKRVVDKRRIARLEPGKRKTPDPTEYGNPQNDEGGKPSADKNSDEEEDEISPEEAQMFAVENEQLFDEMNSLVDDVKNIEGKVVEISRLQEIFADKILEQDSDINRIAETVVGTTENIKDANEEIREAIKNNAGMRVWILFFLTVCSFSLLFLDWYNP